MIFLLLVFKNLITWIMKSLFLLNRPLLALRTYFTLLSTSLNSWGTWKSTVADWTFSRNGGLHLAGGGHGVHSIGKATCFVRCFYEHFCLGQFSISSSRYKMPMTEIFWHSEGKQESPWGMTSVLALYR